jgi:hypothetical protein
MHSRLNIPPLPGFVALLAVLAMMQVLMPSRLLAQDDLQITIAQDTFGGYYKPGRWFPVVVRVANQPRDGRAGDRSLDFEGSLIVQSSSGSGQSSSFNFRRDISVPAFSTQQFPVYSRIRQDLMVPPTLEVRTSTGRRVKAEPVAALQAVPRNRALLVTVTEQLRRLYFPNPRAGAASIIEGTLPPASMFDDWMGYDSVDVLVFPTWPEGRLSTRGREAIEDWVSMGGTLVFLGGSNSAAYAAAEGDSLLPVDVASSSRFVLDARQGALRLAGPEEDIGEAPSLILSNFSLRPDAEVLLNLGTEDAPVPAIAQKRLGKGRILFVGTDFMADSGLSRAAFGPTWQSLLPVPDPLDWQLSLPTALRQTKTVTGAAARPPNLFLVIALCIIYTLIVGPINFLVLGMTKRIQWAWVTVPAIVLFFTGLIYAIGVWTKGGQTITRETTLILGRQDDHHFEEISTYSLFVQDPGIYRAFPDNPKMAVADANNWLSPHFLTDGMLGASLLADASGDGLGFAQRRPNIVTTSTGVRVESWPLRTYDTTQFVARGPHVREGSLRSTLSLENQSSSWWLEGGLTNETGLDFYATALISGTRGLPLGAMKSGATIDVDRNASRLWFSQGPLVLWRPLNDFVDRVTALTNLKTDSDEAINRENAAVMLRHLALPHEISTILPPLKGRVWFVGLAEESAISADLGVEADVVARSIIVLVELNPVPKSSSFVVHHEMSRPRLLNYPERSDFSFESGRGARAGFQQAFMQGTGEPALTLGPETGIVLTFDLPFEHPGARVNGATREMRLEANRVSSLFSANLLGLLTGAGRPISGPVTDTERQFFTPGNGRGWIQLVGGKLDDQFINEPTRIHSVGMEMMGVIDR